MRSSRNIGGFGLSLLIGTKYCRRELVLFAVRMPPVEENLVVAFAHSEYLTNKALDARYALGHPQPQLRYPKLDRSGGIVGCNLDRWRADTYYEARAVRYMMAARRIGEAESEPLRWTRCRCPFRQARSTASDGTGRLSDQARRAGSGRSRHALAKVNYSSSASRNLPERNRPAVAS